MGGSQLSKGHLPLRKVTEKEAQEGDRGDALGERAGTPRVGLTPFLTTLSQYKSILGKWPRLTWNDFHKSSMNLSPALTDFETSRFSVLMGVETTLDWITEWTKGEETCSLRADQEEYFSNHLAS